MKPFSSTAFLVISSTVLLFLNGSLPTVLFRTSQFCSGSETECSYGCCPIANGTCCSDGYQCCKQGEICFPRTRTCFSLQTPKVGLVSKRATPVILPASDDVNSIPCPPCTTTCGEEKCCYFRDGTCCDDGQHCCPYGYACDIVQKLCYMTVSNELEANLDGNTAITTMRKAMNKAPYEICPDGDVKCPSYSSCCDNDYGLWSCCLKPLEVYESNIC